MKPASATIISLFALSINSGAANSASNSNLKECMAIASEYNEGMPMSVGNGVTVTGIGCKVEDDRIVLFYNNIIDTTTSGIKTVSSLKNQRTTATCTKPNMRELLNFFDMEWIYHEKRNSAFMGSIKVKKEYCPK